MSTNTFKTTNSLPPTMVTIQVTIKNHPYDISDDLGDGKSGLCAVKRHFGQENGMVLKFESKEKAQEFIDDPEIKEWFQKSKMTNPKIIE